MNIIIVGAGRVGSQLAVLLSRNGHNVSVIDRDAAAFKSLGRDFNGRTIKGLGFDEDVLKEAGIEECDVLAAVTNLDNTNLMTVEVARHIFEVPRVMTRLYNPDRAEPYALLGLDYVCGTTLVSEEMFAKIESGRGHHLDTFGDFEIMRFSFQVDDEGLRVSTLEDLGDIRVIAVEHEESTQLPLPSTVLHDGDSLLVAVHVNDLDALSKYVRN